MLEPGASCRASVHKAVPKTSPLVPSASVREWLEEQGMLSRYSSHPLVVAVPVLPSSQQPLARIASRFFPAALVRHRCLEQYSISTVHTLLILPRAERV